MIVCRARRPERDFVIISNAVLRDSRLSYRARGVLACLLSYPEGYEIDSKRLAREGKEGRDAVRTSFRELEALGYMRRQNWQDEKGLWRSKATIFDEPSIPPPTKDDDLSPQPDLGWDAYVADEPEPENPAPVNQEPGPENPAPDNRAPVNQALKERLTKEDNNNDDSASAGEAETPDGVLAKAAARGRIKPMKIDFDGKGFINVTDEQMELWKAAYPAVNVPAALSRAAAWLDANPQNTKSNYKRFVVNWLAREQDRAPRVAGRSAAPPGRRAPAPLPTAADFGPAGVTDL